MPKINSTRTFTACWTCRRRNVRCDTTRPSCSQCKRSRFTCDGYDIRLVWVDQETGAYLPQQRRAYACSATWKGYPQWTSQQVDHLINECEQQQCQCVLHQTPSPFTTLRCDGTESSLALHPCRDHHFGEDERVSRGARPGGESSGMYNSLSVPDSSVTLNVCRNLFLVCVAESSPELDRSLSLIVPLDCKLDNRICPKASTSLHRNGTRGRRDSDSDSCTSFANFLHEPSNVLGRNAEESRLFHHFTSHLSTQMIPIDIENNPWKSTYPLMAAQEALTSYGGTRSLYHGIIALSGLHLAGLRGSFQGKEDAVIATRYHGLALKELRTNLSYASGNSYNTLLAAMIVITLSEQCFEGTSPGWRAHLVGALQFVMHDLSQASRIQDHDVWLTTQTLTMFTIIAQTTVSHTRASTGLLREIHHVLHDVMARPRFGYTVGGNARLLNAIYQIRLLEEQMNVAEAIHDTEADIAIHQQAVAIMQQLRVDASDDDVDVYLCGDRPLSDLDNSPEKRRQVKAHLDLFAASIIIYCQTKVLRTKPSTVSKYVFKVLASANALANCGAVFIWSVFVAAVEAYTPESRALATRFFDQAEKRGGANSRTMHRVIRHVWADRERLAAEWCCDMGEVSIDWREVMKTLNTDLLLL